MKIKVKFRCRRCLFIGKVQVDAPQSGDNAEQWMGTEILMHTVLTHSLMTASMCSCKTYEVIFRTPPRLEVIDGKFLWT